jgi:serine/threonine-protein kinase
MSATVTLPKLPGLTDYELIRLLGEGGMGKAFLARCKHSGDTVVVKTIHEHLLKDAKTRTRFHQETDLMRRFRHPNAVGFIEASAPSIEPPYIVMEYVRGITLDDLMQQHDRLPPLRAGKILAQLCLFLQTAHDKGLLHRDLTPPNIMIVDEGTPHESIKVMDFGLARRIGFYIPTGQLDRASSGIDGGTPDYICPEQIEGRQVDHRGDIYSVGVLLYGMLTGHVPYEEIKDPMDILRVKLHTPAPRFSHWKVSGIPSMLEQITLSCLSKAPADRPESARALIEMYQLALGCRLVDDQSFEESSENAVSTLHESHLYDPRNVIDQFDAMMVEQLAAMKLRGFVDGVGGQVIESDAGVIKVKLPTLGAVTEKKRFFGFGKKVEQQIDWVPLELHMAKKQVGTRSLVEIQVVQPVRSHQHKQFCDEVCRELRAYLMVGR